MDRATHVVYILKSFNHPTKCYVGVTQNLQNRLHEHNSKLSNYTRQYAPWYVETYIVFKDKKLAEHFEKYLKKGSGQAFLTKRLLPTIIKAQAK